MSYYTERNGLANWWDRDHDRLELARWVFHHPETLQAFADKLAEYGIDLIHHPTSEEDPTWNISIFIDQLAALTKDDIDDITGVHLDGE